MKGLDEALMKRFFALPIIDQLTILHDLKQTFIKHLKTFEKVNETFKIEPEITN